MKYEHARILDRAIAKTFDQRTQRTQNRLIRELVEMYRDYDEIPDMMNGYAFAGFLTLTDNDVQAETVADFIRRHRLAEHTMIQNWIDERTRK